MNRRRALLSVFIGVLMASTLICAGKAVYALGELVGAGKVQIRVFVDDPINHEPLRQVWSNVPDRLPPPVDNLLIEGISQAEPLNWHISSCSIDLTGGFNYDERREKLLAIPVFPAEDRLPAP